MSSRTVRAVPGEVHTKRVSSKPVLCIVHGCLELCREYLVRMRERVVTMGKRRGTRGLDNSPSKVLATYRPRGSRPGTYEAVSSTRLYRVLDPPTPGSYRKTKVTGIQSGLL